MCILLDLDFTHSDKYIFMIFHNTVKACIFGDDPGQWTTITVTNCAYDSTAEVINKLKNAYMAVHQNKNDPTSGTKMKKAIWISSAHHYNDLIGTLIAKTSPLNHSLQNSQIIQTNNLVTVIKQINLQTMDVLHSSTHRLAFIKNKIYSKEMENDE